MKNKLDVIKFRKKIFRTKVFEKFNNIFDEMLIPNVFDENNCIPSVFFKKNYDKEICKFSCEPYKSMYKEISKFAKDKKYNKEVILMVHPFYPILRHANFLIQDKDYFEKYKIYENKIINLLKTSKKDIILFESPDSFARYTYKYYKRGKIKKVIFTEHSNGIFLDKKVLKDLKINKNCEIVGCYGNNCLSDVENQLQFLNPLRNNELILERAVTLKIKNN